MTEFVDAYEERQNREDVRAGMLMSLVFNMWKGKGQRAKKPADFFPNLASIPTPVQSPKQMQTFFLSLAARSKDAKVIHA